MKKTFYIYLLLAIATGLAIGWMDSQPNWDDTSITVFLILLSSALFGFLTFEKPWVIALAVCCWIPLWAIFSTHNYGGFVAFVPGFMGAYAGYFIKYMLSKNE